MTEVPRRLAHFCDAEGQFLESVRRATLERAGQGNRMSIYSADGKSSTELVSYEILPTSGVRATIQRIGPVEHLTVWKDGRRVISAERQADAYIVFRHAITPWEEKFTKAEEQRAAQQGK